LFPRLKKEKKEEESDWLNENEGCWLLFSSSSLVPRVFIQEDGFKDDATIGILVGCSSNQIENTLVNIWIFVLFLDFWRSSGRTCCRISRPGVPFSTPMIR
jgi:hypothetical protein